MRYGIPLPPFSGGSQTPKTRVLTCEVCKRSNPETTRRAVIPDSRANDADSANWFCGTPRFVVNTRVFDPPLNGGVGIPIVFILMLLLTTLLAGCESTPTVDRIDEARQAYAANQHYDVLKIAGPMAKGRSPLSYEAAYLAGNSAQHVNLYDDAERYLKHAAKSSDPDLSGDALSALGLLYNQQRRYSDAARALTGAADRSQGEDKANAYFYAGVAQQKLGWWPQARESLLLARRYTRNTELRDRIESYLKTTGFALQFGAYVDVSLAQRHAARLSQNARTRTYGSARVVPGTDDRRQMIYRVLLGRFSSHATAMHAKQRMAAGEAIIVPLAGR